MNKLLFISNIPCILLLLIAGYMMYADKGSWGWLIFVAMLICHGPTSYSDNEASQ